MTKVFKTKWFNIERIKFKSSNYYKLNHPNSVIILAITNKQKVIVIEQFRHIQKNKTLEFPSGGINKKETPLKAAKRELLEESGYISNNWKFIGKGILRLERENSVNYFYLAKNCKFKKKVKEKINVKIYTKKKFKILIKNKLFNQIAAFPILIWVKKYKINLID
tara:strand:+ start:688 stop:1182 length:495 start_codon:yes stop_codon:yes gene_type:complete